MATGNEGVAVEVLPDGRHRWTLPTFYGSIVHECPSLVAVAEAIVREAFTRLAA